MTASTDVGMSYRPAKIDNGNLAPSEPILSIIKAECVVRETRAKVFLVVGLTAGGDGEVGEADECIGFLAMNLAVVNHAKLGHPGAPFAHERHRDAGHVPRSVLFDRAHRIKTDVRYFGHRVGQRVRSIVAKLRGCRHPHRYVDAAVHFSADVHKIKCGVTVPKRKLRANADNVMGAFSSHSGCSHAKVFDRVLHLIVH